MSKMYRMSGNDYASATELVKAYVAEGNPIDEDHWGVMSVRTDEPSCLCEGQEYVDLPLTLGDALRHAACEQRIGEDSDDESDDESDLACAQIEAIDNFKRSLLGGKR